MTAWRSEFRYFFIYHYTIGYAQHPRTPPSSPAITYSEFYLLLIRGGEC